MRGTDGTIGLFVSGFAILLTAAVAGAAEPPTSVFEYQSALRRQREQGETTYPPQVIRRYNLQRVMNDRLDVRSRAESLKLLKTLGIGSGPVADALSELLRREDTPELLYRMALEALLEAGQPDLAAHVVRALPRLGESDSLRTRVLQWLSDHPTPEAFAEVVRLWAREPLSGPLEPQFRAVVERLRPGDWRSALLDALNAESFTARGSALDVLAARTEPEQLRRRVAALDPRSEAVEAMQRVLGKLDYLPSSGAELLETVVIAKTAGDRLDAVAALARRWRAQSGYRFNIRDFHLLNGLAAEPDLASLSREELIRRVHRHLAPRREVPAAHAGASALGTDRYTAQIDALDQADLWNILLLDEMLSRPYNRAALKRTARRDRADRFGAWGGLVRLIDGQALPRLYPRAAAQQGDDRVYAPSPALLRDVRNALCLFHARFNRPENAALAGPTPRELRFAEERNLYGLVLTSVSGEVFCAHYYTPDGLVVSLGCQEFIEPRPREN
jgi:hypothetical protein